MRYAITACLYTIIQITIMHICDAEPPVWVKVLAAIIFMCATVSYVLFILSRENIITMQAQQIEFQQAIVDEATRAAMMELKERMN